MQHDNTLPERDAYPDLEPQRPWELSSYRPSAVAQGATPLLPKIQCFAHHPRAAEPDNKVQAHGCLPTLPTPAPAAKGRLSSSQRP